MTFWTKWKAEPAPTSLLLATANEQYYPEEGLLKQSSASYWRKIRWATFTFTVATVLILSYRSIRQPTAIRTTVQQKDTGSLLLECGNTSEEAMSRGCVMEPMIYGWVPPACYFANLSTQYQVFTDRTWYSDPGFGERHKIPPQQLWEGKYKHIYSHRYHTEHCLFCWRKLAWAVEHRSLWLDAEALQLSHTDHCAQTLSESCEQGPGIKIDLELGFYPCVELSWA